MNTPFFPRAICLLSLVVLVSCSAVYSPYIYDRTAELKTETMTLMNKGTEPFGKYASKINQLKVDLESVRQQEQLRRHNSVKQKQWALQFDSTGYLLYGFLNKWKQDTVLSETFVSLQRKLVGEAFDLIQETEKDRSN